ncbi:germin-like protein subfamily 3 member 2 [Punica granatum]|uniref:Germin-like protein n=2 Tax=Punica granatum TaxID=22663 RepID=A0A6P8BTZ9_PUNGR|nr:germin-like protein subfamily 3 member 2 [Punica granatum]
MSQKILIILFIFLHCQVILASDPDPVQDFCIAHEAESGLNLQCKNSSLATVEDFVFSGVKSPGKFSETGLSATSVNSKIFPGLNTLGMSFVRADLEPGGINPPHFHPRATEIVFVLEGKVYSGFVDTQNRVFSRVIEKGEVMVFPRGLLHFQMNVGYERATILGSFDSQNPGLQRIANAVFGSGIEEGLLEKAFGLSPKELAKLRRKFASEHKE